MPFSRLRSGFGCDLVTWCHQRRFWRSVLRVPSRSGSAPLQISPGSELGAPRPARYSERLRAQSGCVRPPPGPLGCGGDLAPDRLPGLRGVCVARRGVVQALRLVLAAAGLRQRLRVPALPPLLPRGAQGEEAFQAGLLTPSPQRHRRRHRWSSRGRLRCILRPKIRQVRPANDGQTSSSRSAFCCSSSPSLALPRSASSSLVASLSLSLFLFLSMCMPHHRALDRTFEGRLGEGPPCTVKARPPRQAFVCVAATRSGRIRIAHAGPFSWHTRPGMPQHPTHESP